MKIRTNFVSNSSSTSFTLYGIRINNQKEFLEKYGDEMHKWGLTEYSGDYSDYIGLIISGEFEYSPDSDMKDDETKIQFMERIKNSFPEDLQDQCGWYSESYYDG